ncbi:glycosyltransferase [Sphingomicrobium sp. XHP0235]|uniref:glycosyltransferase family 2 protein n=1 Tax=Sphingomicrobium aquimarinum TaxID=3133971 RepID=UPI0031FE5AA1
MSNARLVTIGLPFMDPGDCLAEAVRSVFAQTHADWELILIDDGSTDQSLERVRSIDDPRVQVISDGANKGLAARLNQIADLARGEIICRMDADDLMMPDRLARQLAVLDGLPEVDVLATGNFSIDDEGALVGLRDRLHVEFDVLGLLSGSQGLLHPTCMFRRDWALRHRYDPARRRAQDLDLWVRAVSAGDFRARVIPDLLYIYRDDRSISGAKLRAAYRVQQRLVSRHAPARERAGLLARLAVKTALSPLTAFASYRRFLRDRRKTRLPTPAERATFMKAMRTIERTSVPGWDR